jgi:hypothetical protein
MDSIEKTHSLASLFNRKSIFLESSATRIVQSIFTVTKINKFCFVRFCFVFTNKLRFTWRHLVWWFPLWINTALDQSVADSALALARFRKDYTILMEIGSPALRHPKDVKKTFCLHLIIIVRMRFYYYCAFILDCTSRYLDYNTSVGLSLQDQQ